ncbi:MAG: hypothetical protein AB8B56_21525, partial [Crocinitomicaceae bacterium]
MIYSLLKKYYVLIAAIVCSITFGIYYFSVHSNGNTDSAYRSFQDDFRAKQELLDSELNFFKQSIAFKDVDDIWRELDDKSPVNFHVYRNDSLAFWNTNQLPIIRFAEIHFPSDGILHLQNGWYCAKTIKVGDYKICGSFLIKQDYSYENRELVNAFSPELELPFLASLSVDEERGYQVKMKDGSFAFSIIRDELQPITRWESVMLFLLLMTSLALWILLLTKVTRRLPRKVRFFVPLGVIALRYLSIKMGWFSFMEGTEVYEPSLYGTDDWFPNFVEYAVNVSIFIYIMYELRQVLSLLKEGVVSKFVAAGFFIASVAWWELLVHLLHGLIEDSSIPLIIDQLFELNIYSMVAIASVGFFIYAFYLLVRDTITKCKELGWSAVHIAMIVFFGSCVFLFYEINEGNDLSFNGLFPAFLYGLMVYLIYRFDGIKQLGAGLILLLLFSLIIAANIADFNQKRERSERELYANQLATEKNIATEAEYFQLSKKIKEDKLLQHFIGSPQAVSLSVFQEGIERRLFNGYWERYEMAFSLFDENKKPLIEYRKDPDALYNELQSIIDKSGVPSELDSNIYFISDYTGQYSYIIRQPLVSEDTTATAILFCTLKSKKIPEEIGFPRLLISQQTNVFNTLEAYSIAKYHNGRLVTKYGNFNYPSSHRAMIPSELKTKGFFDFGEFNHYALKKDTNDVVILSSKNFTA